MKKNLKEYKTIAIISATLILSLYDFTANLKIEQNNIIIRIFLGSTTFIILFELILFIYKTYFWRFIHYNSILEGDWTYTYDIYKKNSKEIDPEKTDRKGEAQIVHKMDKFSITANSIDDKFITESKGAKTLWSSNSYYFKDNILTVSTDFSNELGTALGFWTFHIIKTENSFFNFVKPKTMNIHFIYYVNKTQIVRGRMVFTRKKQKKAPNKM